MAISPTHIGSQALMALPAALPAAFDAPVLLAEAPPEPVVVEAGVPLVDVPDEEDEVLPPLLLAWHSPWMELMLVEAVISTSLVPQFMYWARWMALPVWSKTA